MPTPAKKPIPEGFHTVTPHLVIRGAADAIEFYKKAEKAGIKPIIGMEAYVVTKGSRLEKASQASEGGGRRSVYHHIVLLAKNETGYRNLVKLCSIGHLEGYYYKPRIDKDLLRRHREGLIASSACLAGGDSPCHPGRRPEKGRTDHPGI